MPKVKSNLRNIPLNTFYKVYSETAMRIYDDTDIALWQRVFNFILLEVEFEQGYVATSFVKKLAAYFQVHENNINRAISKLIDKEWLLRYPYGAKRAKGYVINPDRFWVGGEESRLRKIAIYNNTMNKLQIEIDTTDNDNVEVVLIDHNTGESVNTKWNKKAPLQVA